MGKIRIKHLGFEEQEAKEREKRQRQRQEKKKRQRTKEALVPGLKGDQRLVAMTTQEDVDQLAKIAKEEEKIKEELQKGRKTSVEKRAKPKRKKLRSKAYRRALAKIDPYCQYPIDQAVKLLRQISYTRFNGTVEAHINTTQAGIRGTAHLPHGTGKERKVAIASDQLIEEIKGGKIDFDILVAAPEMMTKLVHVAKILGPRGLMPNPKTGTISPEPEKLVKELQSGKIEYKTEPKAPVIHQVIGKLNFDDRKLIENFQTLISAIDPTMIESVTLASTMSPGIKVKFS